ncbi:glycine cleavage T C-terminal barrel domain-containing protein [Naasia sp. SYSU D00948]|uniref:CAF17-like 4Fe-4S cluster assembly/insertion protein YgfZ n=1 Tax=Naasia sp. SYSU D00948 TaxID=2817379 RepID=UPI0027DC078B|nr:glycine cleavage T C-terminal barrel domain-containing protein [Naasia sp. SYSU D00948]
MESETISPLLGVPGAVDSAGPDAGVPAHYGSPLAEQRALASGVAIAEVGRGVVTVTGPDRLSWLDSLTSQRLTGLQPGESAESLLLDPHGHVEHDLRIVDDGDTAWLLVQREEAPSLAAFLTRMRFLLRVEVVDVTETTAVLGGLEGSTVPVPALVTWADPWRTGAPGGVQYASPAAHPASEWTWTETVVRRDDVAALADLARRGEVRLAGALAVEALRVAAWRPRLGADTDERTIPHELDWLRSAVHLSKGCYRGQETVAKVHNLGRPPRRLVLLHLDGSENVPVVSGAPVLDRATGKEVGAVTSPAVHHELGPIALAVVKRGLDAAAPLVVSVDGEAVAATQEVIVPADAGAALGDLPKLPRLGSAARR